MLLGHTTVCAVEIEPSRRKDLLQRQRDGILPRFPIWDDIQTFDGIPWRGRADVVCGGFPCQDISSAGKGAGIEGRRSGLWGEMARVVREVGPSYVFVENSPRLTSRGLFRVLGDLASMGYDARWGMLRGHHAGAPQSRERIWIFGQLANAMLRDRKMVGLVPGGRRLGELDAKNLAWSSKGEPGMVGMVNGVAKRMDRLRAIGDGQIPGVVSLAWRLIGPKSTQNS